MIKKLGDDGPLYARELRLALAQAQMTQADLSTKIGKSEAVVSYVASGTRVPNVGFVNAVNAALPVPDLTKDRLSTAAAVDHGFSIRLPEDW